jgi:surface antigen
VVGDAQSHSIAVFSSSLVGGVGHVAWVDAVNGKDITITEMNNGPGATVANGYHTACFHEFDTRTVEAVPGISYILIP